MVTRRKNVAWDSDRAHSEGQTSLEVLLAWLADPFNYARWKGGVVTKEDLCSEVNSALRGERIHHRKNLDVRVKIMKLEKTFAAAHQWLIDTGLYDSVLRDECSADVKANLNKLCRYYDILAPGMRETLTAGSSSSSEPTSPPKGPHVVRAVRPPPKQKSVRKTLLTKGATKVVAKPVAQPAAKPVPAKTSYTDPSDEDDESSDSSDVTPEQKSDTKKASVVVDVPAAKPSKPDTVNESSDSDDDSSSSSAGEEVEIPAAQEAPADTSDTSSDEDEASEKDVVVPSAEEAVDHEEAESEEEDSEEEKKPEKVTAKASPNGNANGKRKHGGADAQAVKLVTPLMASQQRIAIAPTASPAPKRSDSETKESSQEVPAMSKDMVQATSLRHLRVLHRLDVEDRREKRKRQRNLYELEHKKLQAELETKQMQRDQEKMNLEVARALARQKLLAAGVSQQQVDRALAK